MTSLRFATLSTVLLAGTMLFSACLGKGTPAPTPTPTPIPEKINTIDVTERPYARLVPSLNGRNVTLMVQDVKKPAAKGEYEIEYQTGNLLQGAGGRVDVKKLPFSTDILLGSCSSGGKCTYHEDVSGGSILLRFQDPEKYVLKSDWSFWANKAKETKLVSRDSKFVIDGKGLAAVPFGIVLQSPGYPQNPTAKVISAVYSVGLAKAPSGTSTVQIRLTEDAAQATMQAWDGTAWKPLKTTVADKVATATVPSLAEAYLVTVAE